IIKSLSKDLDCPRLSHPRTCPVPVTTLHPRGASHLTSEAKFSQKFVYTPFAWEAAGLPMKKGTFKLNSFEEKKKVSNKALEEISVSSNQAQSIGKLKGITERLRSCPIFYISTEMQYDDSS
ncbi:16096_t:CDS:2, partial [Funneliformis caledonium]